MKTSQFYHNEKREKVEIWNEFANGKYDYWEKVNGVSKILTEKQYENRVKKYNLERLYA